MSASPTSPSNRKRQPASAPVQPQAIAPAPTVATSAATQNTATTQASSSTPQQQAQQQASQQTSQPPQQQQQHQPLAPAVPAPINIEAAKQIADSPSIKSPQSPSSARKRKAREMASGSDPVKTGGEPSASGRPSAEQGKSAQEAAASASSPAETSPVQPTPPAKKSRTNTPWTPAEERKLKTLRDAGSSWGEIAKEFPHRTEGSVKKHWYKDMHYADFAEDESAALLAAIREYEANKWKEIGKKVGKPAKACRRDGH